MNKHKQNKDKDKNEKEQADIKLINEHFKELFSDDDSSSFDRHIKLERVLNRYGGLRV
jgi:hypothetical protein